MIIVDKSSCPQHMEYSKPKKQTTLCLVYNHPEILLGMKKRGFGEGRWNGFGGKVKEDETIEEATVREMREECGLEISEMEKVGVLEFDADHFKEIIIVHVFRVDKFSGDLVESEEMKPQWFRIDDIPFTDMWTDDPYWMPLLLQGKKFKGKFLFREDESVENYDLIQVDNLL